MTRFYQAAVILLCLALAAEPAANSGEATSRVPPSPEMVLTLRLHCLLSEVAGGRISEFGAKQLELPYPPYHATDFFADTKVAELAEAARDGRLDRVDAMAAEGVKVNARGPKGLTPLIYSMSGKTLSGFERLLERGADPNLDMEDGESAVSIAAQRSRSEALKIVLARGGNPKLRIRLGPPRPEAWYTPIHAAVWMYQSENVSMLIKAGGRRQREGLRRIDAAGDRGDGGGVRCGLRADRGGGQRPRNAPRRQGSGPQRRGHHFDPGHSPAHDVGEQQRPVRRRREEELRRCVELLRKKGVDFTKSNAADLKMMELFADIFDTGGKLTPADAATLGFTYPPYRARTSSPIPRSPNSPRRQGKAGSTGWRD